MWAETEIRAPLSTSAHPELGIRKFNKIFFWVNKIERLKLVRMKKVGLTLITIKKLNISFLIISIFVCNCSYVPNSNVHLLTYGNVNYFNTNFNVLGSLRNSDIRKLGYHPNYLDYSYTHKFKNTFISGQVGYVNLAFSSGYVFDTLALISLGTYVDLGAIGGRINYTQRIWKRLFLSVDYFRGFYYVSDELAFYNEYGAYSDNCFKISCEYIIVNETNKILPIVKPYLLTDLKSINFGFSITFSKTGW